MKINFNRIKNVVQNLDNKYFMYYEDETNHKDIHKELLNRHVFLKSKPVHFFLFVHNLHKELIRKRKSIFHTTIKEPGCFYAYNLTGHQFWKYLL